MTFRQLLFPFIALNLVLVDSLQSQENPARVRRIAVLRMKNTDPTPVNMRPLGDFASRLNSALSQNSFDVPTEAVLLKALKDAGISSDDLLDLDACFEAGMSLNAEHVVVGSISQRMNTLYTVSRIYSVADKSLKAVITVDQSMQSLSELIGVIAHRIGKAIEQPLAIDSAYKSFQWSREFRFAFGPDRVDLQAPKVYSVSNNPPFEISLKAQMEAGVGVTIIELFVDNQIIGAIDPSMEAPRNLREKEIKIAGHVFCFETELKQLRGPAGRAITSALVAIKARCCDED